MKQTVSGDIVIVPFRCIPFNKIFRHNKSWCKRYPTKGKFLANGCTYVGTVNATAIVILNEKTFDIEQVKHIINPEILVATFKSGMKILYES